MKQLLSAVFLTVFMLFMSVNAAAYDTSLADKSGATALTDEYGTETDFSRVFHVIRDSLGEYLKTVTKSVLLLLSVVILSSVFSSYCGGTGTLQSALSYASVLAVSCVAFSMLKSVFTFAADTLSSLCRYMTAFLPVAASLYTLGGSVTTGVAGSSALLAFLSIAGGFVSDFLFPLMQGGFILALAGALPNTNALRSVANLAKSALTTLLAFVFSIFDMVMYLQTVITAKADSFAFRTVKFASGAFIPVIGNMLGDAARTVSASAGVVRATVGGAGIITLLAVTLPSVIFTLLYKLGILLSAMLARALGCENESRLLYDINSILAVLLAIQLGVSVMFIIAVALFIRIGVDV